MLVIVGPTAAGKSAIALAVCEALGGAIISADSVQAYRGADIGSAKATAAEQQRVRHYCLDMADPGEQVDAARWTAAADAAIAAIHARGELPVVCGGTGFYVRALLRGLMALPPIDEAVRAEVREALTTFGAEALHAKLSLVDPKAADRIAPGDTQRVGRALEVYRSTGRPLSAWQSDHRFATPRYPSARVVGLWPERSALYARIDERVPRMLEAGWVEEVRRLLDRGAPPSAMPLSALGYREVVAHVNGALDAATLIPAVQQAHRRYARRQLTWFRRSTPRDQPLTHLDPGATDTIERILGIAGEAGATLPPGLA